jgi:hypothetical protein
LSGPGTAYLVERGSLGRTDWQLGADARVTVAHAWGWWRTFVYLEAFNLGNRQAVATRNQVYTEDVAAPAAGASGRAPLAAIQGPSGAPVSANPAYLAPTSTNPPLLLRLGIGAEM